MTRSGDWQRMGEIITDEMLEKFVPRGTYEEIAAIYTARYGNLARRITFPVPENPADDALAADEVEAETGEKTVET